MSGNHPAFINGFLPANDPLTKLPAAFTAWEEVAGELRKLLLSSNFRHLIRQLPPFPTREADTPEKLERAMLILSFLGHAYIWGQQTAPSSLPENLAKPWCEIATKLGRPPVLSYASYALHNWQRLEKNKPVAAGNIALSQNFFGGIDEEWFVIIHIDIEQKAASAIQALRPAQQSAIDGNTSTLRDHLKNIAGALSAICASLDRMPEHCDPYIYYNRVRPYIHGWKNNPALPEGMIYENCFNNQPQFFRGETGAQSTIIPSLDAVLGIHHENDDLRAYLQEMRDYMPSAHRAFLNTLEKSSSVRECVLANRQDAELRDSYNHCIELITRFRHTHLHYAATYIQQQSQHSALNPVAVGTGGTPFMRYLKKHEDETGKFRIPA